MHLRLQPRGGHIALVRFEWCGKLLKIGEIGKQRFSQVGMQSWKQPTETRSYGSGSYPPICRHDRHMRRRNGDGQPRRSCVGASRQHYQVVSSWSELVKRLGVNVRDLDVQCFETPQMLQCLLHGDLHLHSQSQNSFGLQFFIEAKSCVKLLSICGDLAELLKRKVREGKS